MQDLKAANIPTAIHYPIPLNKQPLFKKYKHINASHLKTADKISKRIFSIPMHPYLTKQQQEIIVNAIFTQKTSL